MNRATVPKFVRRLHGDQRGSISIVTVFAVLLLAVLLGMVINVGRHADRKVKMQNSADAAAYSGGVVLARGMNALASTNHLLCEVFAMTAYLREARDGNPEALARASLDHWDEQQAAVAERLLPVLENILEAELIPEFQRALVRTTPGLAQAATDAIARRHGDAGRGLSGGEPMRAVLWRTDITVVGGAEEGRSSLPVADPVHDRSPQQPDYQRIAAEQRRELADWYLEQLNRPGLREAERAGNMSQFAPRGRGLGSEELRRLLEEEYADRNLPFVLRSESELLDPNQYLERHFMFVGVAYWPQMPARLPGLFRNPLDADDAAFAQVFVFLPRPRLVKRPGAAIAGRVYRENSPTHWDLMNQNWTVQLVPATSRSVPAILQTAPPGSSIRSPNLGGITIESFRRINTH